MPATERSNSRTSMDRPSPSATRPIVAKQLHDAEIVPTLKKQPWPRSMIPSTMMAQAMMVKGRMVGTGKFD